MTESGEVPPEGGLSPTTGLPTDRPYRPFLVIIGNSFQARPPWGLSQADIVYEMIIWGPGHTRYAALYNDNHLEKVGPVRSARYYQTYLCQEWECPFVFYGGQGYKMEDSRVDERFDVPKRLLFNGQVVGAYTKAYSRDMTRVSPHNAIANLALMAAECWPADAADESLPYAPRLPLFEFSQTPANGAEPATEVEIHFEGIDKKKPNYLTGYAYNPETHAYERTTCGREEVDAESGNRVVAHNVIIQFCKTAYRYERLSDPTVEMLGEGRIDAFIDGTRIQGSWVRASVEDQTQFYDADGNVLQLRPGKTFIQVVPETYGFDYDEETTLCRYAPDL